jgi:hypothetical protein
MFERLEPPRGGLFRLRNRIAQRDRRRVLMRRGLLATAACAVLIYVSRPTPSFDEALAAAEGPHQQATLRLVGKHDGIAFYWAANDPAVER